jgi:hypothetical protein
MTLQIHKEQGLAPLNGRVTAYLVGEQFALQPDRVAPAEFVA